MNAGARPLRLAHLTTGDISLRYLLLAQLLAGTDRGWLVSGISAPGPDTTFLEVRGVRHIPLPSSTRAMSMRDDVRAARELWRVLRAERFDVLHTHNPKTGIYGRILGRLAGVPVVVHTTHGLYASPADHLVKRLLVYGAEAVASRFSDAELIQNPEDFALMTRLHLVPRQRARLLGNGVDLEGFDPGSLSAEQRSAVRAELGIRPGQVVVGAVGRLVAEKGFNDLFACLPELGANVVLIVAGGEDPQKASALSAKAVADAKAAGVRFLGMRTDMQAVYAAMDIFAHPSHREGFPRVAMEAAAMGLPIVATDIRGCREVVHHEFNGLLVPVRSPRALADSIRRLAADPSARHAMGSAGQRLARERFDERVVVEIVLDTYREVLARRTRHRLGRRMHYRLPREGVSAAGIMPPHT